MQRSRPWPTAHCSRPACLTSLRSDMKQFAPLCLLLTVIRAQPRGELFRTELFPEQLQQQQVQLIQRQIQDHLQLLQAQAQASRSAEQQVSSSYVCLHDGHKAQSAPATSCAHSLFLALQILIQRQQSELLQQLQDAQRQQQELQRRLQEQLNGIRQQPFQPPVPQVQAIRPFQPPVPQFQAQPQEAVRFPSEPEPVDQPPHCSTVSGEPGLCRPLVKCITFYAEVPELRRQPCRLQGQEVGVCCPLRKRPSGECPSQITISAQPRTRWKLQSRQGD